MNLPPLHPALVHLPIAFVMLSFLGDLAGKVTHRDSLRLLGFWSMLAALLGGGVTIAAGYWDMSHAALTAETDQFVHLHLKIGWILAAGILCLTIWRWRIRQQARRFVTAPYLAGSFLIFTLTIFQGWYGGEMVYSQGAGVAVAGQGTEPPGTAGHRLADVYDALGTGAMGAPARGTQHERGHGQSAPNTNSSSHQ